MEASPLRHPLTPPLSQGNTADGKSRPTVAPFARALSLLSAFMPHERWLGNSELVLRTGLPASTVTRIAHSLVTLGYLHHAPDRRKFRLAPSVLALGYGAAAQSEVQVLTNPHMRAFAEQHQVHVSLCARDRLDLVVIDRCETPALPASLQLDLGTRLGLATSAAGWALLAALPEDERQYLMQSVVRPPAQEWNHLHRRSNEAMGQVREGGFCVAPGGVGQPMTMVAAPVRLQGRAPLALSCMGPSKLMNRNRTLRELGPALANMAREIQRQGLQA